MLIIHVPDNASEYDHQQAREALALALSVVPGSVQTSEQVTPAPERVSKPAPKGTPAKGSPEAKERMAKARAAKAAKAGQPSQPKASDRMAALAQRAGIAATPASQPKAPKATSQRYSLPTWAADIDDADFEALEAFAGRLVDDRKLKAFVLYLQGKAEASSLEDVASRTGTLRSHAERVVTRARRGESD